MEVRPAQPQSLHHTWAIVLDDDVSLAHDVQRKVPLPWIFQVQRNRTFAPIEGGKILAEPAGMGRPMPQHVAIGRFDFDDIGAHIREQHPAKWPCSHIAELGHYHAGQRKLLRISLRIHGVSSLTSRYSVFRPIHVLPWFRGKLTRL